MCGVDVGKGFLLERFVFGICVYVCVFDVHGRDGVVKLRVSTCSADDDGSTLRCVN